MKIKCTLTLTAPHAWGKEAETLLSFSKMHPTRLIETETFEESLAWPWTTRLIREVPKKSSVFCILDLVSDEHVEVYIGGLTHPLASQRICLPMVCETSDIYLSRADITPH